VSLKRVHVLILTGWFISLIAAIGIFLGPGLPGTWPLSAALFVLGCAPVAVLLAVFQGAPPQTVAEILYDADQSGAGIGRTRLNESRPTETDLL
jgi:hypothetical protein